MAALVALAVHKILVVLVRPLLDERHPYLRALLRATNAPARLALLVLALFVALPVTSFSDDTTALLFGILSLATILLTGWIMIAAAHLASELYLVRTVRDAATLLARKHVTQVRVLLHVVDTLIVLLTLGAALMTFEPVRQFGVSLFASAGVAGLVAGLAARPMLSNLIAGIQIATTQPIRIDDEVVIEGQWGRVQEITSTYVVIGLWDLRQLIVPLSYFIEKSFENWTRNSTDLLGAVTFHVDYTVPVARLREKAIEIVKASPSWDGKTVQLQVNDAKELSLELRVLVSARSSSALGDLRLENPGEDDRVPAAGLSLMPAAMDRCGRASRRSARRDRTAGGAAALLRRFATSALRQAAWLPYGQRSPGKPKLALACEGNIPMKKQRDNRDSTSTVASWLIAAAIMTPSLVALPTIAQAQAWPTRPVTAVIPFSAGNANDVVGRIVLDQLSRQLGEPVVIDNRVGAGGTAGVAYAAKATPDGYTILVHSSTFSAAVAIYKTLPYDTLGDFTPVIPLGRSRRCWSRHRPRAGRPRRN